MSIPAGRDLFVLAYEFAQDKTDAWTDAKISKFDIMNNEYVVSGYCVQKIMVGFQKQSYDVILKSDKDTLSVTVEKNALIGKTISWNVRVSDIEENKPSDSLKKTVDKFDSELPEEYKYAYKLHG